MQPASVKRLKVILAMEFEPTFINDDDDADAAPGRGFQASVNCFPHVPVLRCRSRA